MSRRRYIITPNATSKGVVTATVSDGHRLFVKSTDATDTMAFTVTIKPGGKYHVMELNSAGA